MSLRIGIGTNLRIQSSSINWASYWATHLFGQNDLNTWIKSGTRNGLTLPDTISPGTNDASILLPYLYKPAGTEYAYRNNAADLDIGITDFTLCCWVKSESIDKTALQIFIGKHKGGADSYSIYQAATTGFLTGYIESTGGAITFTSTTDLTTAGWVFLRLDINQATLKARFFINEIQQGTDYDFTGTFSATNYVFGIGDRGATGTYISKTSHSDTYIYRRILTPTEGTTLMARGFVTGATAHWPLNEQVDLTVGRRLFYDVSGNSYHLLPEVVAPTNRKFGIEGSRYLLDKGYSLYNNITYGNIYAGYAYSGVPITGVNASFTKIKDYPGNLTNHNLADSYILFAGAGWDRSNATIFSASARTGYYDVSNPKRWHPSELNQETISSWLNTNYKTIDYVKLSTDSIYGRDYLQELISYNTAKSGNDFKNVLRYTNDYDYIFAGIITTLSDLGFSPCNYASGQYYNGKTYVAFMGDDEDPYITTYTHSTGLWATPVKIGTDPMLNGDGHGGPSMLIDSSGYIHIMFGCHDTAIQYSKSNNPEDISAWTSMTSPAVAGTYPQLIQFSNGTIYLFYRLSVGNWGFNTSTNNGTSWSSYTSLITGISYAIFRKGIGDTIHCSANGTGSTGFDRYNAYYLFFNGTVWKNGAGTTLTLPLASPLTDVIIYNSGANAIPMTTVGFDSLNVPYVLFTEGTLIPEFGTYNYKLAKWNGATFDVISLGTSTNANSSYACAIDVKTGGNIDVYIITTGTGVMIGGNIEKWSSSDSGATWSKSSTILTGNYLHPSIVKNYNSNAKILFGEYRGISTVWNGKGFLYGDGGFIRNNNW